MSTARFCFFALFISLCLGLCISVAHASDPSKLLVEAYRTFHTQKDLEALKSLVFWEESAESTHAAIEERLAMHLELAIDMIEFRPLSGTEKFGPDGYQPNLPPVGYLVMTFVSPLQEDSRYLGKFFVVGERDGCYWISMARAGD